MKRVCVFCGSSFGTREAYRLAAVGFGRLLAEKGLGLVYGGGNVGLMGALARAALGAGGEVIGVIPGFMTEKELALREVTELRVVGSMHERKALMAFLAGAFVALPGGAGTLEELTEVFTWSYLGLHRKPIGILDVEGYYEPFLGFLERAVQEGFLKAEQLEGLIVETNPERLLQELVRRMPREVEEVPPVI